MKSSLLRNCLFAYVISLLSMSTAYSHKEWVHQYQVIEAYSLLKAQTNINQLSPAFDSFIGTQIRVPSHQSIGTVTDGAYAEDLWDVLENNYGWVGERISATHFWDADVSNLYQNNNLEWLTGTYTNAYRKAEWLWNGGVEVFMRGPFNFYQWGTPEELALIDQGLAPHDSWLAMVISYDRLPFMWRDAKYNFIGVVTVAGNFIRFSHPYTITNSGSFFAYFFSANILGRVAHLLGDMSVPAHVRPRSHPCDITRGSRYELYMGGIFNGGLNCNIFTDVFPAQNWDHQLALNQGGFIDPLGRNNPLRYLFYTTNQITDCFTEYREDGNWNSFDTFLGDRTYLTNDPTTGDDYGILQNIIDNIPTSFQSWTEERESIANTSFAFSMRAIAGLLYYFAVEADIVKAPLVENRFLTSQATFQSAGNLIIDEVASCTNIFISGSHPLLSGGVHTYRSEYPRYDDFIEPNTIHKFDLWNNAITDYSFVKLSATGNEKISFLSPTNAAILNARCLEGIQIPNVNLFFRDPWLTIRDIACYYLQPNITSLASYFEQLPTGSNGYNLLSSSYGSSNYGGIFKNKAPNANNLNFPYYSIRASKYLTPQFNHRSWSLGNPLNPGDLIFQDWQQSVGVGVSPEPNQSLELWEYRTNAIEFISSDAEVNALYKAHLHSNKSISYTISDCSTWPNSQRKLALDGNGSLHLTYESMGHIYYTYSYGDGDFPGISYWKPEIQLDNNGNLSPSGSCSAPSIASSGQQILVVWNQNGYVKARKKNHYPGINWEQEININPCLQTAHPVVAADSANQVFLVAYETTEGVKIEIIQNNGSIFEETFSSTNAFYPSIANNFLSFYLTWYDASVVKYIQITVSIDPKTGQMTYSKYPPNPEPVPFSGGISNPIAPSITVSGGCPSVSWTSTFNTPSDIMFSQKIGASWGATEIFINQNGQSWAPSVAASDILGSSEKIRIAHNLTSPGGGSSIFLWKLNDGTWSPESSCYGDAIHPNTTLHNSRLYNYPSYSNDLRLVYPTPSTIHPQLTQMLISDDCLSKVMSSPAICSRELVIKKDTTEISLRLGEISIHKQNQFENIEWNLGYDTLVLGKTTTIDEQYRTKSFIIEDGTHLKYRVDDKRHGNHSFSSSVALQIKLIDAGNNQVLATLGNVPLLSMPQGKRSNNITHSLNQFSGKNVYLQMSMSGEDQDISLYQIDYYSPQGQSLPKEGSAEKLTWQVLSNEYQLSHNYPNPFGAATLSRNPTTEISYSIPEGINVRISVIDALGREVDILVNEYKEAGMYTVTFNGEKYSSGVYYYRLVAGSIILTRKMSLVR